jgi:hypothetical protein
VLFTAFPAAVTAEAGLAEGAERTASFLAWGNLKSSLTSLSVAEEVK